MVEIYRNKMVFYPHFQQKEKKLDISLDLEGKLRFDSLLSHH